MNKSTWTLALTGEIGSGKTTALSYFAQNGAAVLSADEVVAQLYAERRTQKKLVEVFDTFDKKKIAALSFNDKEKRAQLEHILHPLVLRRVEAFLKQVNTNLAVVEIPLLFEVGWQVYFDLTAVVVADPKTLPDRLQERGLTQEEYETRLRSQCPQTQKIQWADVVLYHANKNDLKLKVNRLCKLLGQLHKK